MSKAQYSSPPPSTPPLHGGAEARFYGQCTNKNLKFNPIKYLLPIVYLLLFTLTSTSAQVEGIAKLDSNLAETGNPFVIHLLTPSVHGKPLQVDFSAWDTILPKQNILTQSPAISQGAQYQIDLTCITFDADTLLLPPLTIRLAGGKTAVTNPLELVVLATPAPVDLNDMAELKGIRREPIAWTDYLPWILGVLGIASLVLLANWWWRQRQQRGSRSQAVAMPADLLAQRKLVALSKKQLWQSGQVKAYYAELTFILREYLQKRYQVPALESTTEETLAHLQKTDFPQDLRHSLVETFLQADLVKFAKSMPPESFHTAALQQVQSLVQSTREETVAEMSLSN